LYGHQREVAVLSEYDGEARLVQAAGELDAEGCAAVFVCELGHEGERLVHAAAAGTLVVDMTGSVEGTVLAGTPAATTGTRLVEIPHALTTLVLPLLAPLHRSLGVTRASVFVLRPASDFGEPGLEELREQTVHLLRFEPTPTEVFGRQLAFNVLPQHLAPSGEEHAAARVVRDCRALLGAPELPIAISLALVPSFYGHAIAAHVDLGRLDRNEALAAWRAMPGVAVDDDAEAGATLDAPEGGRIVVARVDAVGPSTLSIWAVGSDAGVGAAARAVTVAVEAGVL
jgi:aspartate-semialdehyde dehydrogenase